MSDHLRLSSPASSSPRRAAISRPEWPWSSRRYTSPALHQSPPSSLGANSLWDQARPSSSSSSVTHLGASSSSSWHTSATSRHTTPSATMGFATQEESTRQWNFMGFEWTIREVHKLRDHIEGAPLDPDDGPQRLGEPRPPSEHNDFEILRQSPMLGDNKFKLEISETLLHEGEPPVPPKIPTLSLYITPLTVDFTHADYGLSACMMAAIKCQGDRTGERGARAEWVWEFWQNDWVFRQESEVWECPLPPLSELLRNPRIKDADSFVICVQIHCPVGPFIPQHPSIYYVPKDLLDGLEASLDNPNTGDVKFICLEKLAADAQLSPNLSSTEATSPGTRRSSSSASTHVPFPTKTTGRKRVIYAHSDILIRRSEYFATMLSSSFAEGERLVLGERTIYTVVVEEADFETMYWLLKFCYANWLLFTENDDPRAAVDGVGAGWSAKWLHAGGGEWDWKTFQKASSGDESTFDARSATSGSSIEVSSAKSKTFEAGTTPTLPASSVQPRIVSSASKQGLAANLPSASTPRQNPTTPRRQTPGSTNVMPMAMSGSSSAPRSKPVPIPVSQTNYSPSSHYPVSPRAPRSNTASTPDPHLHPTPAPRPASALSMYQTAHRYAMPGLASLALEHMMATITPQSSFALLLATSVWDELHLLIEDYVVEKWDEVSVSEEFEQCCQEVAGGEWGTDGGKTLAALFRRLRSPTGLYPRT
ncbi:hypothetical protein BD779DRAFT_1492351 [Infundibulicybe gibba]|nr:hypothetical protein BD779DRAFT_1492351 [Infundibulicybe gibba]